MWVPLVRLSRFRSRADAGQIEYCFRGGAMSGQKKESYVSYLESNSRSISSDSPIKEFMTPHLSQDD
jgi:hypothetical protein